MNLQISIELADFMQEVLAGTRWTAPAVGIVEAEIYKFYCTGFFNILKFKFFDHTEKAPVAFVLIARPSNGFFCFISRIKL